MAPRIEQDPLQLLDVRHDEVEQRLAGLRPRCRASAAAIDASLRPISPATMAGSVSIGSGARAEQRSGGPVVRERSG